MAVRGSCALDDRCKKHKKNVVQTTEEIKDTVYI
jgi:hypothetical protein